MKRIKPWLLLLLVFLAGFAGGIVVTRITVRHVIQRMARDPDYMRDRIEHRMAARLRLDSQQRAKVHEVLIETQGQLKDLHAEFQPRFREIMNHAQAEIVATLTPQQRQRFERFKEENRVWFQRP